MKRKVLIVAIFSTMMITIVGCSNNKGSVSDLNDTTTSQSIDNSIDEKEAEKIALERSGSGNIDDIVLNAENIFEVKLSDNKFSYKVNVSKSNGKIVNFEKIPLDVDNKENIPNTESNQNQQPNTNVNGNNQQSNNSQNNSQNNFNNNPTISRAEAERIALEKSNGGRIISSESDFDDGYFKYDFEIINNNVEYDISIDGNTGNILNYETDHDRYF